MLLNCDLGEVEWDENDPGESPSPEELAMPHIHMANIACGFHAGGPDAMRRTLHLASRHGVAVGAHPSYPDRDNFGRRSMRLSRQAIIDIVHYQVAALEGMARNRQLRLHHVKPHGALYNDMMANDAVRDAVFEAISSYATPLPLVMQATPAQQHHREQAAAAGITVLFEAFADRRYRDDGLLQPRGEAGAVLGRDAMLAQVERLRRDGTVVCAGGATLSLEVDTLCVHGDNAQGVQAIRDIRRLLASP